jgi:hypothetical protein
MNDQYLQIVSESIVDAQQSVWNSIVNENAREHMLLEQYMMKRSPEQITMESGDLGIRIWQLLKKTSKATGGIADHANNLLKGIFHVKHGEKKVKKTPNAVANEIVPNTKLPKAQQEVESHLKTPFKGQENVVLTATPIFIKEITEDESLYIGMFGVNYTKNDKGKLKHVSNSNGIKGLEDNTIIYKNMVYYVKHPDALKNLAMIVEDAGKLVDGKDVNQEELRKAIKQTISKSHAFGVDFNAGATKLSMKELTNFAATINQLTNAMDKFQNGNNSLKGLDSETITLMNKLVRELETCQHGINGLANEVGKLYMIKAQYVNSITDKNDLAKFVEECIDNGVPPKFVAYNTWLIAHEDIRGSKTDFAKVPMGQTRMVFFPKDKKIITKIAFSGRGLTSNKNEVRMSEFIQRSKEEDIIKISAPILGKYGKDCAIIDMERIIDRAGKHPNPKMLNEVKGQFIDFVQRHPELRLVVTDFNDGNIMWSSDRNCWVCIDYGCGQRDNSSDEKMKERAEKKQEEYKKKTGKENILNVTETK